jgi:RsiW-degrading membrane proteinase PrsW (M82 family)
MNTSTARDADSGAASSNAYRAAAVAGAVGLAAVVWSSVAEASAPPAALLVGAGAAPVAVLLVVWGRLGGRLPGGALLGGALVGPLVAVLSHGIVLAFAAAFFLNFAEQGRHLLDTLRVDPRITTVLSSPWVTLLLIEVAVVAPVTEEAGKALGARFGAPRDRREAFLAGAAAGAGFAIVEGLLYASAGAAFGGPWPAIAAGRALGAAVHPLASGIVVLGWWEWKRDRSTLRLARRFLCGAGIHALWNGSLVALAVVETAFHVNDAAGTGPLSTVALGYSAAMGAVLAGVLWRVCGRVANGQEPFGPPSGREPGPVDRAESAIDGPSLAGWALVGASLLIPVALVVLAFPGFSTG